MVEQDERVEALAEVVRAGLRKCRVEDAPVPLIREGDMYHATHMVTAELLASPAMRDLLARAWDDGYNDAATMARCYGHTDHWEESDEPTNPYRAAPLAPDQPAAAPDTPKETPHE